MNAGKTLFAQIMEFVPWTSFARIVNRCAGNAGVRRITCAEQFRVLAFAQLTWCESLHAIDRFFMLLRRRVSLLERSISTASKAGRTWNGYSPYNPANVQKALDIFRTFYNFCLVGKDDKSPAMRLGLTEHAYAVRDHSV